MKLPSGRQGSGSRGLKCMWSSGALSGSRSGVLHSRHGMILTAGSAVIGVAACRGLWVHNILRGQGNFGIGGDLVSEVLGSTDRKGIRGGSRSKTRSYPQKTSTDFPITVSQGLLGLNILMYGIQVLTKDAITVWGAKVNQLILNGQYWRLITPAFFHGNLMHLAVNCYSLYNIAPALERLTGKKRLVVAYLVAAVAGNVASFYGSPAPSLGASGAVFGLGGALAMYFYQNKTIYGKRSDYVLKQLWQTLLINMAYGFANPRIDNWGHFGGLLGGALVAYLFGPRLKVIKTSRSLAKNSNSSASTYIVDVPPLPLLAADPIRVS